MINYVYLKLYWIGFRLGLRIVNGNYDVWFTGQNPISYDYGIDIYKCFLYFDMIEDWSYFNNMVDWFL
jgi:hypothetical protein